MKIRPVKVVEKPNGIYVCYLDRSKGRRHCAAQFDKSVKDLAGVREWVMEQDNLILVTTTNKQN